MVNFFDSVRPKGINIPDRFDGNLIPRKSIGAGSTCRD